MRRKHLHLYPLERIRMTLVTLPGYAFSQRCSSRIWVGVVLSGGKAFMTMCVPIAAAAIGLRAVIPLIIVIIAVNSGEFLVIVLTQSITQTSAVAYV